MVDASPDDTLGAVMAQLSELQKQQTEILDQQAESIDLQQESKDSLQGLFSIVNKLAKSLKKFPSGATPQS
jgi:uncharacterized protein YoxC